MFKRRRPGSRPSSDRALIKQAGLVHKVEVLTAQLRAAGVRSARKQAISQIAEKDGVSIKTIEAAITRVKKNLSK